MNFLSGYLLKLSISLGVVYGFYFLVLRPLTFYNWNRWYLLIYTATCFFIPFIDISAWFKIETNHVLSTIPSFDLSAFNGSPKKLPATNHFTEEALRFVPFIFIAGMAILLMRLLLQYISFLRLKKQSLLISNQEVKIYDVKKRIIPFSMGKSIFINAGIDNKDSLKEIIRHEFVHVKQRHTIDILFSEIVCIVNWYNPFIWLIRHAIRQNLEFIADNNVLQNGLDKKEYQYLLLKVMGVSPCSIASQFNFSSLKKRIIMMNKMKSARVHLVRFLFALPLAAILLLAFRNKNLQPGPSVIFSNGTVTNSKSYPLPWDSMPPNVKSLNVQNNKVTVTLKDGNTEKYNLDNEKERALFKKMYGDLPKPPPPPAPLIEAVTPPSPPTPPAAPLVAPPSPPVPPVAPPAPGVDKKDKTAFADPALAPVYFINNIEQPAGFDIKNINPAYIESIQVLKGDNVVDAFGNNAKNGIVKITLRSDAKKEAPGTDTLLLVPGKNDNPTLALNNSDAPATNNKLSIVTRTPNNILYIIDDKEAGKSEMSLLKPETIESINVIKDQKAIEQYGDKGKNGVIKITIKPIPAS